MTIPDTCGSEGGAVSVWMNIDECETESGGLNIFGGLITSLKHSGAGFSFYFFQGNIW